MTGAFNGRRKTPLKLETGAGQSARKDFPLVVDKLEEKIGVLIVDIADTGFFEPAIFLAMFSARRQVGVNGGGAVVAAPT